MAGSLLHVITTVATASATVGERSRVRPPEKTRNSKVLVLGGTGRIGGATAEALSKMCPELKILIGGRNRERGAALEAKLGKNSQFVQVDIDNMYSLEAALKDADLVVHTAGPFQQTEKCTVLEAAIETKTAYLDISDDTSYALRAKSYEDRAADADIPAITAAGIYPGVSNVMAAEMVCLAKSKSKGEPERLSFSYYAAGTGGAGPAILASSFLLLGEDVIAYNKGEKTKLKPYSEALSVDFGRGIGRKDVYPLNFPEVESTHKTLGVPTVTAHFGTDPFFWNLGMEAMANLLPTQLLQNRSLVQQSVQLLDPLVREVDRFFGEHVSLRVDLECSDGLNTVGVFTHRSLSGAVGRAIASFALAILEGSTQPGVWFPEEPEGIAVEARKLLLRRAAKGTTNFLMNRPPWMVENDPIELGFGLGIFF